MLNFKLSLLTLMSRFSRVLLLLIFTEIMPKETKVTKSRYIKDKVDALSKEKAQLKE